MQKAGKPRGAALCGASEFRDDRRDVVVLFLRAESPHRIHDCGQQTLT